MKTPFDSLRFSAQALAAAAGGKVVRSGGAEYAGLVTDSREAYSHCIFLALRGEHTDGHRYILSAAERGARCILAEELTKEVSDALPPDCTFILVPDTLAALGNIAKWYKNRTAPRVAAVTGSVGKTTTKQMIYSVVSRAVPTLCTEGNFNSELGLPLTLLRLEDFHRAAVLETGMNHAGELSRLSHICEPDIAVITNIGTSHIENLGSREGIRDAKLELLDGMKPGGTVILNGDEPLLTEKRAEISARGFHVITFGISHADVDFRAENLRLTAYDCTFDLRDTHTDRLFRDLHIPAAGRHNVGNACAAFLCGQCFAMKEDEIRAGLSHFENLRQTVVPVGEQTFLEDCYNASPESVKAELAVLSALAGEKHGRALAVLGDMLELGEQGPALHRQVGEAAAASGTSLLFTFGPGALEIAAGAKAAGMDDGQIISFPDADDPQALADCIREAMLPGDVILFKASHGMALERVTALLKKRTEP